MSTPIRVARLDEVPPDQGKIVAVGGCDVAIYNLQGRYYAATKHDPHLGADDLPGHSAPCIAGGRRFDVAANSPARVRDGHGRYAVIVRGDELLLLVDAARAD